MGNGTGFFLHLVSGEVIAIHEHASAVIESPERFGLKKSDVAQLSPTQDRRDILESVFLKLWIRIRHRKTEVSVEFLTEWLPTLEVVAQALDELGIGELSWITFRHLSGESLGVHVYELKQRFNQGTISDLLDRIEM